MAVFIDVKASGIEQGNVTSSGTASSTTRVRSVNRFQVPQLASVRVVASGTANTGKQLRYYLYGYTSSSTTSATNSDGWRTLPLDGSDYIVTWRTGTSTYIRLVLSYTDDSEITPSEVESFKITVEELWQAEANDYPFNVMSYEMQVEDTKVKEPFPVMNWRLADSSDSTPTHYDDILKNDDAEYDIPFPKAAWRIDEDFDGNPYTELFMNIPRTIPDPDNPPPSPAPPPSRDPIHITVDNVKRGDAGNSYNNGEWVIPWYNFDNQTYIQVRGQDSIIPVLNSNDESQYTRYPIDDSVIFDL